MRGKQTADVTVDDMIGITPADAGKTVFGFNPFSVV